MDFRFQPDTTDLRDGARAFLEGENTPERLRGLPEGGDPLALWSSLGEMGLIGAGAPESLGGLGLGSDDCLLLSEEAGRAGLPEPYSEVALVLIPLLAKLGGSASTFLNKVLSGEARGAVIHPLNPFANHAETIDFALVLGADKTILADASDLIIEGRDGIDPGRKLAQVSVKGGTELATGKDAADLQAEAAARGGAASAAELCGLSDRMISLATEYSKTREQFGKAIGTFQAVKHLMANAQVKLEFARPAVYRAGAALDGAAEVRDLAVSHAKIASGDAAMLAAENAIQVFGGMGYTFEVDLHFFMKRAWALCAQWGDRNFHLSRVDDAVLGSGVTVGPGETFR